MGLGLGKWQFFVALVVLYLVLGCFVDGVSMIYMTLPVLLFSLSLSLFFSFCPW